MLTFQSFLTSIKFISRKNILTTIAWSARVDNPGKSIGGHRSSTAVPSMATSVAVIVFEVATGVPPVGNGGHRWATGGDRWATDGPSVGYGGPSDGRR